MKFYNWGRFDNNNQPIVYALLLVIVFGFAMSFTYIGFMEETKAQAQTITAATIDNTSSLSINRNSPQPQQPLTNSTTKSLENFIMGSFGNDRISGTPRDNIIVALDGSDSIHGLGGNDKIQGNEGADQLYGEAGNDVVQGGTGSDRFMVAMVMTLWLVGWMMTIWWAVKETTSYTVMLGMIFLLEI